MNRERNTILANHFLVYSCCRLQKVGFYFTQSVPCVLFSWESPESTGSHLTVLRPRIRVWSLEERSHKSESSSYNGPSRRGTTFLNVLYVPVFNLIDILILRISVGFLAEPLEALLHPLVHVLPQLVDIVVVSCIPDLVLGILQLLGNNLEESGHDIRITLKIVLPFFRTLKCQELHPC